MNASYLAVWVGLVSPGADPVASVTDLPIRADAIRTFPAQVQPVLMNLCARCHCRPDHPGGFKLVRVTDGYSDVYATARNLQTAAAFVRADQVASSPLLMKAVSPHGGMKVPPMVGRAHPAFRHLEKWSANALIPSAKPTVVQAAATVPAPPAEPAPLPPIVAKPNPNDPFDPAVFNQTTRGGK